jgi:hypothetical protein
MTAEIEIDDLCERGHLGERWLAPGMVESGTAVQ